jgi:hypothetical protein
MEIAIRVHYAVRRRTETVLEKLPQLGIITRNRYGADILNVDTIMFLDWDAHPAPLRGWRGLMERISTFFKGDHLEATQRGQDQWVQAAKTALEADIRSKVAELNLGIRLYETCNGLRGIVTSSRFDPTDSVALDLMTYLGADPLYVKLCRLQNTFRARLTPKHWRIGLHERPLEKPSVTPLQTTQMTRWLEQYRARSQQYATARLIAAFGVSNTDELVGQIVKLHDERCKVSSGLKLA